MAQSIIVAKAEKFATRNAGKFTRVFTEHGILPFASTPTKCKKDLEELYTQILEFSNVLERESFLDCKYRLVHSAKVTDVYSILIKNTEEANKSHSITKNLTRISDLVRDYSDCFKWKVYTLTRKDPDASSLPKDFKLNLLVKLNVYLRLSFLQELVSEMQSKFNKYQYEVNEKAKELSSQFKVLDSFTPDQPVKRIVLGQKKPKSPVKDKDSHSSSESEDSASTVSSRSKTTKTTST